MSNNELVEHATQLQFVLTDVQSDYLNKLKSTDFGYIRQCVKRDVNRVFSIINDSEYSHEIKKQFVKDYLQFVIAGLEAASQKLDELEI